MDIRLPDINSVIGKIVNLKSTFNGVTKPIHSWIQEHRDQIVYNNSLVKTKSEENNIKILTILLSDLLMRSMRGERGFLIREGLNKFIISSDDLNTMMYERVLTYSKYRWKDEGVQVITNAVDYFKNELQWNWEIYFSEANANYMNNFLNDKLLKIKNIKFKVRDLALSNFNKYYIANDLHIVRVSTRIGLLNYGFSLLKNFDLEMGNNPTNERNYLFLHQLFIKLSQLTKNEYYPVDLDRIFWHFGRTICNNSPNCNTCPINNECLTGKAK